MIFLTTTAIEVDEELLNRCLVLTVDEGREQTRAIHERQRRVADARGPAGAAGARHGCSSLHQNAQRLLAPALRRESVREGAALSRPRRRARGATT